MRRLSLRPMIPLSGVFSSCDVLREELVLHPVEVLEGCDLGLDPRVGLLQVRAHGLEGGSEAAQLVHAIEDYGPDRSPRASLATWRSRIATGPSTFRRRKNQSAKARNANVHSVPPPSRRMLDS